MKEARKLELDVFGAGLVTYAHGDVRRVAGEAPEFDILEEALVEGQEVLAGLAIRAAHQAWTMAGMQLFDRERVGMIFVTAWGTIDATVAYLESMLEAEGRYASPRHFSRSVFSSVTSCVAIHFGIHGPCE